MPATLLLFSRMVGSTFPPLLNSVFASLLMLKLAPAPALRKGEDVWEEREGEEEQGVVDDKSGNDGREEEEGCV